MSQWQPIETAPKGIGDNVDRPPFVDLWAKSKLGEKPRRWTDCWFEPGYPGRDKWLRSTDDGIGVETIPLPTHWMSVPHGPTDSTGVILPWQRYFFNIL